MIFKVLITQVIAHSILNILQASKVVLDQALLASLMIFTNNNFTTLTIILLSILCYWIGDVLMYLLYVPYSHHCTSECSLGMAMSVNAYTVCAL